MLDWRIMTLVGARLKASVGFPPLRGLYQRGTCKGCDNNTFELAKHCGLLEIQVHEIVELYDYNHFISLPLSKKSWAWLKRPTNQNYRHYIYI